MKKVGLVIALLMFNLVGLFSQKSIPQVDYKGHIIHNNKQIGTLNTKGSFDPKGMSITKVNSDGNIVDSMGKVLGKAPKNGNFVYYLGENSEKYSVGNPNHNGMCEVKNVKGETVLLLHKNYKAQAACAIHCLHANHCMPNDSEHKH